MQVHRVERHLSRVLDAAHDHARHPEEQDVVARLHVGGGIEVFVIRRLVGPAERGERPQARREPGVEHVVVLMDVLRTAGGALGRVFARNGHVAVRAIPDRDAVSPPKLTADAPVLDVLQPVVIDLLEAFGHNADASIAHGCERSLGQRFDLHEPLLGDHRLDDLTAALRARDGGEVRLFLDDQACGLHVSPQVLARLEAVLTLILAAVFVDLRRLIEHRDDRQVVTLGDGVVVRVMSRRDLERARAEIHRHVLVGDDGNLASQHWHHHLAADELLVALILGVDGHGRIAQDGLGADGRHGDIDLRGLQDLGGLWSKLVFEVIQRGLLLGVFHFEVRDGGLEARRPVDQARAAIDESLFVEAHEGFAHGAAQAVVEGEALALPVAGGAQAADLSRDLVGVLVFPLPGALEEFLAAQFLARDLLGAQQVTLHHQLRGDARMVGARHPQRGITLHAVIADHQVFHADEHGVTEMQFARHVRRRDGDHERLDRRVEVGFVRVVVRLEVAALFPHLVDARLGGLEVVCFREFVSGHSCSLIRCVTLSAAKSPFQCERCFASLSMTWF